MSEAVFEQVWPLVFGAIFSLWPYFYIRFKKGKNHFLFLSAFYGVLLVTAALLSVFLSPFAIFLVKLVPQFEALGWAVYLEPFVLVCEAIADWYAVLLSPVLYFALPPLLYRRYGVFRLTSG